jgi:hypothetical protein
MITLVSVFIGGVPGWKLSGWSNTRATFSSKNYENYSRSTVGVARYLRSYWDRRADAGCCCACARATAKERGTYAALHKYYHNNFSTDKQNCDVQTREREGSAAPTDEWYYTVQGCRTAPAMSLLSMIFNNEYLFLSSFNHSVPTAKCDTGIRRSKKCPDECDTQFRRIRSAWCLLESPRIGDPSSL